MLRNVIETITETFESIRQIAQDLKEDPSALIRGRAQEE
jgi:hypothetical protein